MRRLLIFYSKHRPIPVSIHFPANSFLLLLLSCCLTAGVQAQFSDDFEWYTPGEYLGLQSSDWGTYSGTVGGEDDVRVVTDRAYSGAQSIHLGDSGTLSDVILPFDSVNIDSGKMVLSLKIYVETSALIYILYDNNDYWVFEADFQANGLLGIKIGDGSQIIEAPYEKNQWLDFMLEMDLDRNEWKLIINEECIGFFENSWDQIGALNLYTTGGESYWVDDVHYDYDEEAKRYETDANLWIGHETKFYGFVGSKSKIMCEVMNMGTSPLTSLGITFTIDTISETQTLTDLNIEQWNTVSFEMEKPFHFTEEGKELSVEMTHINGQAKDDNPCNNSVTDTLWGVYPAPNKKVLGEELTGTWCGWCPGGQVKMESMQHEFGDYWVGIAAHGGDPMADSIYLEGMNMSRYPRVKLMRREEAHPADLEAPFFKAIAEPASGYFKLSNSWDEGARKLEVQTTLIAMTDIPTDYHVALAVIEDEVKGTSAAYNQKNFYSGSAHLIGLDSVDWYDLPNPVPAADMVYNHVARAILPDFGGTPLNALLPAGDSTFFNFSYDVPQDYDINHMKVVAILIRKDSTVDNAEQAPVNVTLTSASEPAFASRVSLFPNPTGTIAHLKMDLEQAADLRLELRSVVGHLLAQKTYSKQAGEVLFPIDVSAFSNGIYLLKIQLGNEFIIRKIIVQK